VRWVTLGIDVVLAVINEIIYVQAIQGKMVVKGIVIPEADTDHDLTQEYVISKTVLLSGIACGIVLGL
jgi:hypothetical protein